jgi:acetyl esterase/lipase
VHENSARLGIDPSNIAIGGVSAGGQLSAVLAQRCHALKIPLKLQILTVPMTDLTLFTDDWSIPSTSQYPSYRENAETPTLPLVRLQFLLRHWLGKRPPHPPPAANPAILSPEVELSPMKAVSVRGLAPALVVTSDVDIIRDDGEAYAKKLMADGVQVKAKRFIGVPHLFTSMDGALPEAREYIQMCVDALKDAFKD